jgi:hypothetical protein
MEWISVEDRLPKDGQEVKFKNKKHAYFGSFHRCKDNAWIFSQISPARVFSNITHWMPLPEPPKE